MAKKKHTIEDNRNMLNDIGKKCKAVFDKTNDFKAATIAIKALGEATKTSVAQIRYKHLTGQPTKIEFLEE